MSGCHKDEASHDQPIPKTYTAISAGLYHSIALGPTGQLWAWGRNQYGELGDGTTNHRLKPTLIDSGYTVISAGGERNLAQKADGTIWAQDRNQYSQLKDGTTVDKNYPVLITNR